MDAFVASVESDSEESCSLQSKTINDWFLYEIQHWTGRQFH